MSRPADRPLGWVLRTVLGLFYRQVHVIGVERIPPSGSVVYLGNHYNSLIDPALLLGWLPPGIRMLAKSTLWSHFPAGLFVRLTGAVPVYRQMDAGIDTSKNTEMFSRCWEILAEGGAIALFPEGVSHDEPALQPLKTGAARIALGTLRRNPGAELTLIPVGLIFEERQRFRSRALIEIGRPIKPAEFLTEDGEEDRAAVRGLTEAIEQELTAATLNYASWEEAEVVRRAAALYISDQADLPSSPAHRIPVHRAFAEGYSEIERQLPEETRQVREEIEAYSRLLELAGLTDRQVASEYKPQLVARFLLRSLIDLLLLLPIGIVGLIIHTVPYLLIRWGSGFADTTGLKATYKVMGSLLFFPLAWLAVAYLTYREFGLVPALGALALAPLTGYPALLLKERFQRLVSESRAFLVLKGSRSPSPDLRARRDALLGSIHRLVEHYWTIVRDQG